jgi:hypothetical protein
MKMIDRLIPIPMLTLNDIIKFYLRVTIKSEIECWNWEGAIKRQNQYSRDGTRTYYIETPEFHINGRIYTATRVAWRVYYNEDPGKLLVCHECDNPICVNKSHLWLGTFSDNMKDMVLKNRRVNGIGKLLDWEREEIKKLHAIGWSFYALGKRFKVKHTTISDLVNGRSWQRR